MSNIKEEVSEENEQALEISKTETKNTVNSILND